MSVVGAAHTPTCNLLRVSGSAQAVAAAGAVQHEVILPSVCNYNYDYFVVLVPDEEVVRHVISLKKNN